VVNVDGNDKKQVSIRINELNELGTVQSSPCEEFKKIMDVNLNVTRRTLHSCFSFTIDSYGDWPILPFNFHGLLPRIK